MTKTWVKLLLVAFAIYTVVRFGVVAVEPPGLIPNDFNVPHNASERLQTHWPSIYNADESSPFKYSPTFLLLYSWTLGGFSNKIAWTIWCSFSIALFLWAVTSLTRSGMSPIPSRRHGLVLAALATVFGWRGYIEHFSYGQADMILFSTFILAASLSESGRRGSQFLAGMLMSLLLTMKPQAGILLSFFAIRGQWLVLAQTAALSLLLLHLPLPFWGAMQYYDLMRKWRESLGRQTPEFITGNLNQSIAAVVARLSAQRQLVVPLGVLFLVVGSIAGAWKRHALRQMHPARLIVATILFYCLLSPLSWRWLTFIWAPAFFILGSDALSKSHSRALTACLTAFCLTGFLLQTVIAKAVGIAEIDNLSWAGLYALGNLLLFSGLIISKKSYHFTS